ncbi:MAG: heavy metal translocating P-type ATPase [Candidatus Accumulibacter sp.]|jgi:Cd2+/Zn2+-exporting ATPase|nr:heavy metal translocating P-type ATPase [Accumulibacter sp.]
MTETAMPESTLPRETLPRHAVARDDGRSPCCPSCCSSRGSSVSAPPESPPATPPPGDARRIRYRIDKMDCPTEERLIRKRLEPMRGVVRLDFDLLARELTVHHQLDDPRPIAAALVSLDMAPRPLAPFTDGAPEAAPPPALDVRQKIALTVGGLAAAGAEAVAWTTGRETSLPVAALAVLSILSAGLPTLKKGWIALKNRELNIHFLMLLAILGALVLGNWPEAAMVIFLFALAETIEGLSLERARRAIRALTALAPDSAEVLADGGWRAARPEEVAVGSRIRVRAGARVPLDARVESGHAALDQAPITGESVPVDKRPGDPLYAGSIVADGALEAIVTAPAGQSTLARIAAAVQEAQAQRAPTQRLVDRFARFYTPAVVALAVLAASLGPWLTGGTWNEWLYHALVVLVIACPCALVVSTPVTVVSGLAAAARRGILVKGGAHLERGRLLRAVAFDKTGTLTLGRAALTDVVALDDSPAGQALRIAASLDEQTTHPLAQALVGGWRERRPDEPPLPVGDFRVLPGRGVRGVVDGREWTLGNRRLAEERGAGSPALAARLAEFERAGKTAAVLFSAAGPAALFGFADPPRPESAQAVAELAALGVRSILLTGDSQAAARAVAERLGIAEARGDLLPEDKQAAIGELKARHGGIGMVGDGVNDAPALARADVGLAMGAAGAASALETADVAIMDDDPRKAAAFIRLSRRTAALLRQNIALALGIKAVFLGLALAGQATLWMAVFADVGASLLVVFNGLRLLRE